MSSEQQVERVIVFPKHAEPISFSGVGIRVLDYNYNPLIIKFAIPLPLYPNLSEVHTFVGIPYHIHETKRT